MKNNLVIIVLVSLVMGLVSCDNQEQKKVNSMVSKKKEGKRKVLILSSSPRKGGNSDLLCDQFMRGATESGHEVEKIFLNDKKINYFGGDDYFKQTGSYAPQDDADEILAKMLAADVIVMATPLYFNTMSGQMKTMIDRTYPHYQEINDKEFYFIITAGVKDKKGLNRAVQEFRGFLDCLKNPVERGVIYGVGTFRKGDVAKTPAMNEAYQMGKDI